MADEVSTAAENCDPVVHTPDNERQARRILDLQRKALASIPPDEQVQTVEREERAVMGRAAAEARQVGGAQTEANLRGAAACCRQLVRRLTKLGSEFQHLTDPAERLLAAVEAAAAEATEG